VAQILSFFRWTHKEHSSECQVRLYVNVKLASGGVAFLKQPGQG